MARTWPSWRGGLALSALVAFIGCKATPAAPAEAEACADAAKACEDGCDVPWGVPHLGRRRFMLGVNYPWYDFGSDFGGLAAWGTAGVAASAPQHAAALARMREHGAGVVRWWMFPDFRGDAVRFDDAGEPQGLAGTAIADIHEALALAEQADVYLELCLFSFDAFRPTVVVGGVKITGLSPIVRQPKLRGAFIERVVRPVARAAAESPYAHRLVAWDVMNEPEWAITGRNPYGDPKYTTMEGLDAVEHGEMETFLAEVIQGLRQESRAKITVGSAGVKWARAWRRLDVDFYQVNWYDWLERWRPHDRPPSAYGLGDKPVVVGEFPAKGLGGFSLLSLTRDWYRAGYAGALGWAYREGMGREELEQVKAFAGDHPCASTYSAGKAAR